MSDLGLARWILHEASQPVTHLALQKLTFYCYGVTLALDLEGEIGIVPFEAWKHGPVNRSIWLECRGFGRGSIPKEALTGSKPRFSPSVDRALRDALTVYGALDAWSLREQSHLEKPWIDAYTATAGSPIAHEELKKHFKARLGGGGVKPPEYLLHTASFTLDGIPVPEFASFGALAEATRASSQA